MDGPIIPYYTLLVTMFSGNGVNYIVQKYLFVKTAMDIKPQYLLNGLCDDDVPNWQIFQK